MKLNSATYEILNGVRCFPYGSSYKGIAVGWNGTIILTADEGGHWDLVASGSKKNLNSVDFPDKHTGLIAGDSGTILRSTDAGLSWTSRPSGTFEDLLTVYFPDSLTGYAAGTNGVVLKTYDGGGNWAPVSSVPTAYVMSLYFTGTNTGYAVGGTLGSGGIIVKTTDGGANWVPVHPQNIGKMNAACFTGLNTGFAAGYGGVILKTSDGGTKVPEIPLNENNMLVYPVPATDHVMVVLPERVNLKKGRLSICDLNGRTVFEQAVLSRSTRVSLSGLGAGVYIIRFSGSNETLTAKVIRRCL